MEEKIIKDQIINNVIRRFPATLEVFHRFGVDACCGGSQSIEEAAKKDGANVEALLESLNSMIEKREGESSPLYEPCFVGRRLGEEECPGKKRLHAIANWIKGILARISFKDKGICNPRVSVK